jgi:hypothetical protein
MAGSIFLILLDVSAGLPFLLAVKPSERTEMSAIYASFRDVSGILTPGAAWLVLLVAPLSGVFAAGGAGLLCTWVLARKLHPRLGRARISVEGVPDNRDDNFSASDGSQADPAVLVTRRRNLARKVWPG